MTYESICLTPMVQQDQYKTKTKKEKKKNTSEPNKYQRPIPLLVTTGNKTSSSLIKTALFPFVLKIHNIV
jgi:hypothetical protein